MYDQDVSNISKRPTLFDMSWWQFQHCMEKEYSQGPWNCTEQAEKFLKLNQTHDFQHHKLKNLK